MIDSKISWNKKKDVPSTNTISVDVLFPSTLPIVASMTIRAFERLKKISEKINARFGT